MEERPPYLIDPGGSPLRVTTDGDGSIVDVAVSGPWTDSLGTAVARTLRKCVAECPAGIMVDLTGIEDPRAASVATWVAAARIAAEALPAVRLAVCPPAGSALAAGLGDAATDLHRAGASADAPSDTDAGPGAGLLILGTPDEARAALTGEQPPAPAIRLSLPPSPTAACTARNLVGDACQEWDLRAMLHPGRAVMSELVANAVEHAGTDVDISVSRRGHGLHLVVRDRAPQLPRIIDLAPVEPGAPLDERGHGLRVVHADSTAWGAMPVTDGKMVWATVRDRAGQPRRW